MFAAKPIEGTKWEEILNYAKEFGEFKAANKYTKEVNLSRDYLYKKIQKTIRKMDLGSQDVGEDEDSENGAGKKGRRLTPEEILANAKAKAQSRKYAYEGIELTKKEKRLIKDIAEGKVDLETASRVIASKAFEKLLKYPDSASFTSFIQSELLKLKRQELTDKNTYAMELVNRLFAGELPPRICPNCGHELVKLPVINGQIIDAEPLPITGKDKD